MLTVTIPLAFDRPEVEKRKLTVLFKKGLTTNQQRIYELLGKDGTLSLQNVSDQTGIGISGVKKIVRQLQDYGILVRVGSKRDGTWVTK